VRVGEHNTYTLVVCSTKPSVCLRQGWENECLGCCPTSPCPALGILRIDGELTTTPSEEKLLHLTKHGSAQTPTQPPRNRGACALLVVTTQPTMEFEAY